MISTRQHLVLRDCSCWCWVAVKVRVGVVGVVRVVVRVGVVVVEMIVVLVEGVGLNQVALVAECRKRIFCILIRSFDAGQMQGHFLCAKVEFVAIVILDPIDHFLFEPAVDVHASPLLNILLHLPQAVGVHLSDPKLAKYLELLDLSAATLHEQEQKEIGVDIDDVVVDRWGEGRHLKQLIDYVDVFQD